MGLKKKENPLELCKRVTQQGNGISVRILEYLSIVKHQPHGFRELANDFLDMSRILWAIEAGLTEAQLKHTTFPTNMVQELDSKFHATIDDFIVLQQMLVKLIEYETKGGFSRRWKMMFVDSDVSKLRDSMAKSREALRISALVFRWSMGNEKADSVAGIGYTALAAALDRMDHSHEHSSTTVVKLSSTPHSNHIGHEAMSPEAPVRSAPAPGKAAGLAVTATELDPELQTPTLHSRSHLHDHALPNLPNLPPAPSLDSASEMLRSLEADRFSNRSAVGSMRSSHIPAGAGSFQATSRVSAVSKDSYRARDRNLSVDTAESDTLIEELMHSVSVSVDGPVSANSREPSIRAPTISPRPDLTTLAAVPRWAPRSLMAANSDKMKQALVMAIQSRKHDLVEQLLDKGVLHDCDTDLPAGLLRAAVLNRDAEALRLLLLFGGDVQADGVDRDGYSPLFSAVQHGFREGAQMLIKYGADANMCAGPDQISPFALAVAENKADFVQLCLMHGGDANAVMGNGNTTFIMAMNRKSPCSLVELLLKHGADPNHKNAEGETPLFEAITHNRPDLVSLLLDRGADPNLPGPKHLLWPSTYKPECLRIMLARGADPRKCSGLIELAASINNLESVRILLAAGVDPNAKKDGTYTALCSAIRDNRGEIVDLLLANGADPNLKASEFPAFKAITHHREHFLDRLVAAGADIHNPKGIVETAVAHNNRDGLLWLLDHGADPNARSADRHTPLTTAIQDNRAEMVDLLLARGADPSVRGHDWPVCMAVKQPALLKRLLPFVAEPRAFKGVLEMAVVAEQLESVKLLLEAGVHVEDKNGGVFSPLTTAIREGHKEIVTYLLDEAGADVNSPGEHLPLIKAIRRHRGDDTEIIEMLLARGADINLMYRGYNPVIQAIENGDANVLRLLVEKGKDPVNLDAKDESGKSVMEIVRSRGWDEAAAILTAGRNGI